MADELYLNGMLAASSCMVVTGIILAAVKTRYEEARAKYRMAKAWMTMAVFALGVLNIVQITIDPNGDWDYLTGCITLAISYLQAMLLTMVVLVFISPKVVTLRLVMSQLAVISAIDVALLASLFLLPEHVFLYVYVMGILLYIAMLVVYTRWYLRSYRCFKQQISDYYEDEEIEHGLGWLRTIFWVGLAVGVLALLMLLGRRDIDLFLTVVFAAFYAFMAACFINYELSTPIVLPALSTEPLPGPEEEGEMKNSTSDDLSSSTFDDLHESEDRLLVHSSLAEWIQQRGYLGTEKAVNDIVGELNMTTEQFHRYFQEVEGEDFRTWRVRKRVEYARLLMEQYPDWPVIRVAQASGFNDRSWFYKQFLKFTGQSVTDFRNK
jgi:AraC-like DNA-binding protein